MRRRQPCGETGQSVVFRDRGAGYRGDIRFQTGCRPTRICRRDNPLAGTMSLPFLLDRWEADAGPPVTPAARHAFSAPKLADVSLRSGLCRTSFAEGKALPYPEPWSASGRATGTDRPTLTFWTWPKL
ncbi:hypothetical protein MKW11_12380 [Gluconobacter frateurii]|uniref:hypothetical protein n=1 Tax=Gluconobacter frateurii TaxID=38308 RepID=UPI001F05683C|nr:hypothetical protein [Gluconobacter frateurii]UMM07989.1 hypothetical protein MKW11_12380 [Gluconobacter frateurii]